MKPAGKAGVTTDPAHETISHLRRQLADYAMAVDLLVRIGECTTENDVIGRIFDLFGEMCAPTTLVFVPVSSTRVGVPYGCPSPDPSAVATVQNLVNAEADYAWTESGTGFLVRVSRQEETLGVLMVEGVAFPENREEYLNLALAVVGVFALAIANARTHQRLEEEAVTDELTGIGNRRAGVERLLQELARSKRTGEPLAVLMIDLDHFKNVNDSFGHGIGDAVLRVTAERMRAAVRDYDLLCRMGGEEFVILAPNTDLRQAAQLGERIRRAVGETPLLTVQGREVTVTVSGGVAVTSRLDTTRDTTAEELLVRADEALYRAKSTGRDRIMCSRVGV